MTGQAMWNTRHATLSQPATVILFHSEHLLLLNDTNKFDQNMELNFFNNYNFSPSQIRSAQFSVYLHVKNVCKRTRFQRTYEDE
jgi:hypothetical protein